MTEAPVIFERGLATIHMGEIDIVVDLSAIGGFGERFGAADIVLADVLGRDAAGDSSLVSLHHSRGQLVLAIHGTIRVVTERVAFVCHRPTFVAGALRCACLRGVMRSGTELAYVLDVEALAARSQSEVSCTSD
ncbi:MAG TPA: hypothetical protein VIV40_37625 [Kofleriaceae bacterium]